MITIAKALPQHSNFVYACIAELEQNNFDPSVFEKIFLNLIQTNRSHAFILLSNNTPIGFMHLYVEYHLHHCGKVAELQELVVLPAYRSAGAGKVAIDFAVRYAKEQECVLLELASHKKREDAHRFYRNNGFTESHLKFTKTLL